MVGRRARPRSLSGVALVAANIVPLVGVLLFGWDLPAIMVLFLAESAVIAFYTIVKMIRPERAFGEVLRGLFTNFIGWREYVSASLSKLMNAPYSRIMMMQVTLIFGGWIILLLKSPIGALVLLVAMKTTADFWSHRKERVTARKLA
jgi:hypothetical protein